MNYIDERNVDIMRYYQTDDSERYVNPRDITIESGYSIEVFAEGLDAPGSILFTDEGELLIANSGYTTGNASVSILRNGFFEIIADNFHMPLLGINYKNGEIYVAHKGCITTINQGGIKKNIITGLPCYGDYSNCRVDFGPDGKMYFGLGTATNSGIVGTDNLWVHDHSCFCDIPGAPIILNGQNFLSDNILIANNDEKINTGAFKPFGESNSLHEVRKGVIKAGGSILRANTDGSDLELVAWGLRCPAYLKFYQNQLYVSNNSYDVRGSRPIGNAPDELLHIVEGTWYGFPDFAGGEPVNTPRFRPNGGAQPELLLTCHPSIPPRPYAIFPPDSFISGFDFNKNREFGNVGVIYIAEFGSIQLSTIGGAKELFPTSGYKVSKVNPFNGNVTTFAINKSGFPSYITREGGLGRPVDIAFGPDGAMYIVDMGISSRENPNIIIPYTGVIWRVTRDN
jgi:glucose/arabinose dehydrogenase